MSVAAIPTEQSWPGIQPFEETAIEAVMFSSMTVSHRFRPSAVSGRALFYGQMTISNSILNIPVQKFLVHISSSGDVIENQPENSWPSIRIEVASGSEGEVLPLSILVAPSENSVDAELLYTRVRYALEKSGEFLIFASESNEPLELRISPLSKDAEQQLLHRAKLFRKLKYIEKVFNVQFSLPNNISPDEVRLIDVIFRGITEGEFSIRSSDITFVGVPTSEIDLTVTPFKETGPFSYIVAKHLELFGQQLPVGTVRVLLNKATLASPRLMEQLTEPKNERLNIRFELLDNQIVHRFETYCQQSRKYRQARLTKFKYELSQQEPKELVDLINESLQNNVSSDEASQIAVGWAQYNDLPDRYCPQKPELDSDSGRWCVPIYLVYANGEGGPVGEIVIDAKTGVIISHTPIEELRSKGLALAKQILHA